MNLNQDKITQIDKQLQDELLRLERSNEGGAARKNSEERIRNKQIALSRIVSRNSRTLDLVERKVFVSTKFEKDVRGNNKLPSWLEETFKIVNAGSRRESHYEPLFGLAPGAGNFIDHIQQKMLKSHFFLSVITAEKDSRHKEWPVNPWLVEELAAAFVLPIPVIITLEQGIPLSDTAVGLLYPAEWQRIRFNKNDIHGYAEDLRKAFKEAHDVQEDMIRRIKVELARLLT